MKKRNIFLSLVVLMFALFLVASCGKKGDTEKEPEPVEISNDAAYDAVQTTVETVLKDASEDKLNQAKIHAAISGEFTDLSKEYFAEKQTISGSVDGAAKIADFSRLDTAELAGNAVIKLNGVEFLLAEIYVKALEMGAHLKTPVFEEEGGWTGETEEEFEYSKGELPEPGEEDEADLKKMIASIDKEAIAQVINMIKEQLPAPKAVQTGSKVSLEFVINDENLEDYLVPIAGLVSGGEFGSEELASIYGMVSLNEIKLVIEVDGVKSIKINLDVNAKIYTFKVNAHLELEISTEDVTVNIPDGKIAEFKAKYEEARAREK